MDKTKKPVAKAPAKAPAAKPASAAAKPAAASIKAVIEKNLKDSAKITNSMCEVITKKIVGHKNAVHGATEVGGIKKDDMMKLIEMLDGMGAATYKTACALRELHQKMN